MSVTREISTDVARNVGMVGLAFMAGVDRAVHNSAVRRAQAVDSVSELAVRLQEARRAQAAAERRAQAAEARATALHVELRRLEGALREERALSMELRSLLGV